MKKCLTCAIIIIIFFGLCFATFLYLRYRISQDEYNPFAEKELELDFSIDKKLPERNEFTAEIPILMYHYIREWDGINQTVGSLTVHPDKFREQVSGLEDLGYSFIGLDDLHKILEKKLNYPKSIALTFDDGYDDFYTYAYHILKEKQIPATVFVIVDNIGKPGYLSWEQIREMDRSGLITIASHNVSHINLAKADLDVTKKEVENSKKTLEQFLNHPVDYFCYPFGALSNGAALAVKSAGYKMAFSTIQDIKQTWTDRFWLPRIRVGAGYSSQTIEEKVVQYKK